ncbi:MAG: DnaJ domain-containing protein [Legionellales bacterium]|nr:DnaJ domain-containing protein [Legionellales bacterium]
MHSAESSEFNMANATVATVTTGGSNPHWESQQNMKNTKQPQAKPQQDNEEEEKKKKKKDDFTSRVAQDLFKEIATYLLGKQDNNAGNQPQYNASNSQGQSDDLIKELRDWYNKYQSWKKDNPKENGESYMDYFTRFFDEHVNGKNNEYQQSSDNDYSNTQYNSQQSNYSQSQRQSNSSGASSAPQNAGPPPNYYETLGVDRNASENEIRKAYRKEALANHPDKHQDSPEESKAAEAKMKELNAAKDTLLDKDKRAAHDRNLDQYNSQQTNTNTPGASPSSAPSPGFSPGG